MQGFLLNLFFECLYFGSEFFDELKLLHHLQALTYVAVCHSKGGLRQSLKQKGNIFNVENFDGMITMVILTAGTKHSEGVRTVAVHADEAVGEHFIATSLGLIMLLAN